jgi:hypothetical protein
MGYAHQHTFRSQQPRDDLAPGFLSRRNQQFVALRLQFRGGFFDIPYVKFDPLVAPEDCQAIDPCQSTTQPPAPTATGQNASHHPARPYIDSRRGLL